LGFEFINEQERSAPAQAPSMEDEMEESSPPGYAGPLKAGAK